VHKAVQLRAEKEIIVMATNKVMAQNKQIAWLSRKYESLMASVLRVAKSRA
jgi:hypothetical protein